MENTTITLKQFVERHKITMTYKVSAVTQTSLIAEPASVVEDMKQRKWYIVTLHIPNDTTSKYERRFVTSYFCHRYADPPSLEGVLHSLIVDISTVEGSTDVDGEFNLYDYVINYSPAFDIEQKAKANRLKDTKQIKQSIKDACERLMRGENFWGQYLMDKETIHWIKYEHTLYKKILMKDKELRRFLGETAYQELLTATEPL